MSWGDAFRRLWADASPAGRRRAAQLAVGEVRLDGPLVFRPRGSEVSAADADAWAARVRDDGTVAPPDPDGGARSA